MTEQIGIRELRQHASRHVAAAAAGSEVTITDRGRPVARLVPLSPLERELRDLIDRYGLTPPSGPAIDWSTWEPARISQDGPPLSEEVDRERDDREHFTA